MTKQDILQEKTIEETLKFYSGKNKGYLDLAMRAGKTRITIELMKRKFKSPSVLIAYPDNKLKNSWETELEKWSYKDATVTFVNFSSLKHYTEEWFEFFVCDEFHSLSPNEKNLAEKIVEHCKFSLFLSGTVTSETKEKWPEFEEIAKYSTLQGIEDGILADYRITVHLVNLDNIVKTPNKKGKLLTEKQKYDNYSYVIQQMKRDGRNSMHLALSRNRLSLSSIGKIEYTKKLLKKLENKRVLVFTGLADVADKFYFSYHSKSLDDAYYQDFMHKRINHLALAAMGKVGVTYPDLDSVILLNFTYNKEESAQILNRAIKLDYHGKIADLHVICLNEPPEIKKVEESLALLDKSKIKYV